MKIYARKGKHPHFDGTEEYYNQLPLPSQVIRLGDYLKNNLGEVYQTEREGNTYAVYAKIFYMIEPEARKVIKKYDKEFQGKEQEIYEMPICFHIATYNGKFIRVNIIQLDNYEMTIDFIKFDRTDLMSLPDCKIKIMEKAKKKIEALYKEDGYEVLI